MVVRPLPPRSWPETISYTVMPAIDRTKTPAAARTDRFQPRTRVPCVRASDQVSSLNASPPATAASDRSPVSGPPGRNCRITVVRSGPAASPRSTVRSTVVRSASADPDSPTAPSTRVASSSGRRGAGDVSLVRTVT